MSKVVVLKTNPVKILSDYQKLIKSFSSSLDKKKPVILKLNLSWTKFYPACSSPPWQVEGVIKGLLNLGFEPKNIVPVENETVVTNVQQGTENHGWLKIFKKYGIKMRFLTKEQYVKYKPKAKMLVLDKIFPRGIYLPKIIFHKNLKKVGYVYLGIFSGLEPLE